MISTLERHQPSLPASWLRQSNPMAFADRLTVPTLLVYADNDQVVPADDVLRFGRAVGENADVRLVSAPNHFQLPEAAGATARRWLSSQAYQGVSENAPQVTNVKNSNVALDVNNLNRMKESRRTKASSIDASETKSQKPSSLKDVQLNPYAR